MKRLIILSICILLLPIAGCRSAAVSKNAVEVVIEGGEKFPDFLVGKWKDEKRNWEFVFEPDGTISSAVIDSGLISVKPEEKVATAPMRDGGKAVYELGQWAVQYSPSSRELAVGVVVDHFRIDMGSYGLEGRSTDWFIGPVSEDSQVWHAQWFAYPEYAAFGPEESIQFPIDPNDNPVDNLVFRKQNKAN